MFLSWRRRTSQNPPRDTFSISLKSRWLALPDGPEWGQGMGDKGRHAAAAIDHETTVSLFSQEKDGTERKLMKR